VQETDENGRIPLHEACRHGNAQVARLLLDTYPSGIGKSDFDNNVPIHEACHNGVTELARNLLYLNPKASVTRNCFGRFPLHEAAQAGDTESVLLLLEASPSSVRAFDEDNRLPLHHACMSGNVETVKCLLRGFKKGAFQMKDKEGMLPIHHAYSKGSLELIEFIYAQNPKAILIEDKQGRLPIHMARINGQSSDVQLVLNAPENVGGPVEVGAGSRWLVCLENIAKHRLVAQAQTYGRSCFAHTDRLTLPLSHHQKKPNGNKSSRRNLLISGFVASVVVWYWFSFRPLPVAKA
jgi:ankyrin repeat protein